MIKRILLALALALTPLAVKAEAIIGGGLATNTAVIFSTNGGYVYSIVISAPNTATVIFYDSDNTNAPYYGTNTTNAAFTYRLTTNGTYVTNFISELGVTNWFTNFGNYTAILTNAAATNQLTPMGAFIVAGGQAVTYNTDMLFRRGITAYISTNATVVVNRRQ